MVRVCATYRDQMQLSLAHKFKALDLEFAFPGRLSLELFVDCRDALHEVLDVVLFDSLVVEEKAW